MLGKLFGGRKKREEEEEKHRAFMVQMMKAAAEGDRISKIRSAASTIGVDTKGAEGTEFVGKVAAGLALHVAAAAGYDIDEDEDAMLSAGMFAFVACNHISYVCGEQFEVSTIVAMLRVVRAPLGDVDKVTALHSEIVGIYNDMSESKAIQALGKTIAAWCASPTRDAEQSLVALFDIFAGSVQDKASPT